MNTHIRRMLTLLLCLVLGATLVFAAGARESAPEAQAGRIAAYEKLADGNYLFSIKDISGNITQWQVSSAVDSTLPLDSYRTGDYVEFVPQATTSEVTSLRWVSALASIEGVHIPLTQLIDTPESLKDRFSYAYGYLISMTLQNQGILADAGLFAKGAIDGASGVTVDSETLMSALDAYQGEYLEVGLQPPFEPKTFSSLDEVMALTQGDDTYSRFSYAYGYLLVQNMIAQGLDVSGTNFAAGGIATQDEMGGILSLDEMNAALNEMQAILTAEQEAMTAELGAQNKAEADAFLAANAQNTGIVTTESGLQYKVLKKGEGKVPATTDTVSVDYRLVNLKGEELDSSYARGVPAEFNLQHLIPGFTEGVSLMPVGSHYLFWIPSNLGYGESGAGTAIGPNLLLIFDVELHSIVEASATPEAAPTAQ